MPLVTQLVVADSFCNELARTTHTAAFHEQGYSGERLCCPDQRQ